MVGRRVRFQVGVGVGCSVGVSEDDGVVSSLRWPSLSLEAE